MISFDGLCFSQYNAFAWVRFHRVEGFFLLLFWGECHA